MPVSNSSNSLPKCFLFETCLNRAIGKSHTKKQTGGAKKVKHFGKKKNVKRK